MRLCVLILTIAMLTGASCAPDGSTPAPAATLTAVVGTAAAGRTPPPQDDATPLSSPSREPSTQPRGCQAPSGAPAALATVFCADVAGMERAAVLDIVDGDTLDVSLEGREERVRIFGIDTPERGDRCFGEASDRLAALAGGSVALLPDARNRDSSGRLLRYLYTPDGLSIDAMMIAEGYARAWTRDGALRDPLIALESHAIKEGAGCLW